MNFVWDITLRAESEGIPREDLFFVPAEDPSPYYEQAFTYLNQYHVDDPVVPINPLMRFAPIFQFVLHPDVMAALFREHQQFIIIFFDALMHMLVESDLCHGMTKQEFYVRQVRNDMRSGEYGKVVKEGMETLDREQQLFIANEMYSVINIGSSLISFSRVMKRIFPDCFIYQSRKRPRTVYVYLPENENDNLSRQWHMIKDTFLPLDIDIKIFWRYHFGIMGLDPAMELNEIALF